MNNIVGSEPQQMRRRTVVKGAAWAAPVVTLGVAAPAMAASPPPVNPELGGESCKHTKGVKRYHVQLIFNNGLNCSTTVNISKFVVIANSGQEVTFTPAPETTFTIDRYSQKSWIYDSDVMGNISQGNVQVVYTYTDCEGGTHDGDVIMNVAQLPPCDFPYPHDGSGETDAAKSDTTDSKATSSDSEPSSTSTSSSSTTESSTTQESTTEAPSAATTQAPSAESTAAPTTD